IAEAGVPGYDTSSWFAFFVPAKTPAEIISKMHADTVAALAEAQIRAKLDALGVVVVGSTPEQLRTHLQAEMKRAAPRLKAANIRVSEVSRAAARTGSPQQRKVKREEGRDEETNDHHDAWHRQLFDLRGHGPRRRNQGSLHPGHRGGISRVGAAIRKGVRAQGHDAVHGDAPCQQALGSRRDL